MSIGQVGILIVNFVRTLKNAPSAGFAIAQCSVTLRIHLSSVVQIKQSALCRLGEIGKHSRLKIYRYGLRVQVPQTAPNTEQTRSKTVVLERVSITSSVGDCMQYIETVNLIERISKNSLYANGEANTKRVLIETILHEVLGYANVSDIEMEYAADVGVKTGEKVDYAVKVNGAVRILVEAKDIREALGTDYITQLYRYYAVTDAEIGILTNGVEWQIYTDTEKANIMDIKPLYTVNLNKYSETDNAVFACLQKGAYSKKNLINVCSRIKAEEKQTQVDRMKEYVLSERINNYLHSGAFCKDLKDNWCITEYKLDTLQELINGVLNGSYVLKYAQEAQNKNNRTRGIKAYNLLSLDDNVDILTDSKSIKVQYTPTQKVYMIKDIRELPYAVTMLIGNVIPIRQFDDVMQKQAAIKRWVTVYNGDAITCIDKQRINDYIIDNARNLCEAVNRSIQIIKAYRLNPLNFTVEML